MKRQHSNGFKEKVSGERKRDRPIRLFLQKYNRLLSLAGAGIVLLTFVIKDGFRESVKDLGDSLNAAESEFAIRRDNTTVFAQLRSFAEDLGLIKHTVKNQTAVNDPTLLLYFDGMAGNKRLFVGASHNIEAQLDNVEMLLDRLQKELPTGAAKVKNLRDRLSKIQRDPRWISVGSIWLQSLIAGPSVAINDDKTTKWLHQITEQLATLADDSDALGEQVLKKAEQVRRKSEDRYTTFTLFSYALYALGWSLGLIGHIYELKDIDVP